MRKRIITKRRVNKAIDELVDAIFENADFDINVCGPQDFDVIPDIARKDVQKIADLVYDILTDKRDRKWWQLLNVSIRRAK